MKIKMKDAGESPEFGPYQAGDEIDETRASVETMKRLVERGVAMEQGDRVAVDLKSKSREHGSLGPKKEE